jgi:hypothetical protein
VYPAVKEGTSQKASIFFFEASKYSNYKLSKENKPKTLDIIRKEASNLARYMHGSVLKLYEPLYEKTDIVASADQAFVTEPVVCTLAEVFESKNVDRIANNDTNLKLVLLEFLEGLQYLADVRPAHPEKHPAPEPQPRDRFRHRRRPPQGRRLLLRLAGENRGPLA